MSKGLILEYHAKMSDLAQKYMHEDWIDSNLIKAKLVPQLLVFHVAYSPDSKLACDLYIDKYFAALRDSNADELEKIPLLNKETCPLFFKTLSEDVIRQVRRSRVLQVDDFASIANNFYSLVKYVSAFEQLPRIISHAIRFGSKFVELFSAKSVIPLTRMYNDEGARVVEIMKHVQSGTKLLQVKL
jgi:hypothetical protein